MNKQQAAIPVDGRAQREESVSPGDILDSLADAVLVVAIDGTVVYRNRQADNSLPSGSTVHQIFESAQHLAPFDGWQEVIARTLGQQSPPPWACIFVAAPENECQVGTIHCRRFQQPRDEMPGAVVLTVRNDGNAHEFDHHLELSKRLASLGKLATRVAHELNNPLDGILRYVNLAMRVASQEPESKLNSYLAESRTGLMRMIQIIGDLLEFSRTTEGEFDSININELIEQAVRNTVAPESAVVVTLDLQDQQMPEIRGGRLYQVCCNLIKNAIDAMPNGGRLSVTTGAVDGDVVILIRDTGPGLPDPPHRVFEAFFTTKPPGEGTGLGLAICRDFVEEMNGTIAAQNATDGGALFTIRIPLSECRLPTIRTGENQGTSERESHRYDK